MKLEEQIAIAQNFAKQGLRNPDSALKILERIANWDLGNGVTCFLIYKGEHPSMTHSRYLIEDEAFKEVERLEQIRITENARLLAVGHGSSFLNRKDWLQWSYKKHVFPE